MISLTLPNAGRFWLFSRMFYGIKPRWKIQVPMEYGDIIKFLRGHFFFDERYPISLDSVYIYIYTYIDIYNYIYTLVLSLYLAIRSSNSIHWSSISTSSLIGGWFAILGTSRVANEIYHWLGGGIIWLTSLSHEKSWNFGPLVACWGFVGDGICNTQLCGGYNNHYN